jgi:hypothetical protein
MIFSRVKCGAAALDQAAVRVAFVGAIDVERQRADGIEIEHLDAAFAQQAGALFGTRHGTLDPVAFAPEGFDEPAHGGAGADADDIAVKHVFQSAFGSEALLFFARIEGHRKVIPG